MPKSKVSDPEKLVRVSFTFWITNCHLEGSKKRKQQRDILVANAEEDEEQKEIAPEIQRGSIHNNSRVSPPVVVVSKFMSGNPREVKKIGEGDDRNLINIMQNMIGS